MQEAALWPEKDIQAVADVAAGALGPPLASSQGWREEVS